MVREDVLALACAYAALREAVDLALIGIGFVPPEDPVRGVEVLAGMARGAEARAGMLGNAGDS